MPHTPSCAEPASASELTAVADDPLLAERQVVKAKFSYMARNLYWRHYDRQDGFIKWSGYDDANWWNNVAPHRRDQKGAVTGRTYRIDFNTDTVEVLP